MDCLGAMIQVGGLAGAEKVKKNADENINYGLSFYEAWSCS